jgi:hypothetical protein
MDDERDVVKKAYDYAKANNQMRYNKKLPDATEEYIFENQIIDANQIISLFWGDSELRVVSIINSVKLVWMV